MVGLDPEPTRALPTAAVGRPGTAHRGRARRFAADPPILLMTSLSARSIRVARVVCRMNSWRCSASEETIIFVSHDIDEALRWPTASAIFKLGASCGKNADALLADASDPFIERFSVAIGL